MMLMMLLMLLVYANIVAKQKQVYVDKISQQDFYEIKNCMKDIKKCGTYHTKFTTAIFPFCVHTILESTGT